MSTSLLLRSSFPRHISAAVSRRAALPAVIQARNVSTSTEYVPGGPIIRGTVNDPTTFPTPSKSHGSYHWAFERLLSAGLIPLTGAAFAVSPTAYPLIDGLLAVSLVVHSHIGFDSVLVDYLHKRKFPIIGPVASWSLKFATIGTLVGLYQFNTQDIGLTELIVKVWTA
ncbi:hypothetical protein JAAARDRAFT_35097 [Jaapia argillacea MUCL 33604]|uniref:Succinate dehydrogenase [ubiquinone] cytochrome b small subunit n=1 Tax=Jaapia argillacea MUCL 33604 TaxID=933084 RepID=A0A067Q462_9AGAM|nr:hypothetical protein JAAARDRAFT_35097 [Jaapia argillacea MUCL 33604]